MRVQSAGMSPRRVWATLVGTAVPAAVLVVLAVPAIASSSGYRDFRSPDRKVTCFVGSGAANCWSSSGPLRRGYPIFGGYAQHLAELSSRGKVTLCQVPSVTLTHQCFQNWNISPVLPRDHHIEIDGVRCESTRNGIVCFRVRRPRRGIGFRINPREAVKIRRHLGPGRLLKTPTTHRSAFFQPSCGFDRGCRARVTIRAGGAVLARGRYSISAHSSPRVGIALTGAGRRAPARKPSVGATLTIVDTRTDKHEALPVILRRQ